MNAPEQLTMFEPMGAELVDLVARHVSVFERKSKAAEFHFLRGWVGAARGLWASAARS